MSYGLEALFQDHLEVFPADSAAAHYPTAAQFQSIVRPLIRERDRLQAQVKEQASTIETLERWLYTKVASHAELPVHVVRRLHLLENQCQQLKDRNAQLSDNLRAAESETATLRDTVAEKSQKVKGASKKVKNAKETAGKEEEKAKGAINDKQRHLASERKMRTERNDALAALATERKIIEDLRAELQVEKSGVPHLRETEGSMSNFTTLVVPIEFKIRRIDHYRTMRRLRSSPDYLLARMQEWHENWRVKHHDESSAEQDDYNEEDDDEDEEEEDGYELADKHEDKLYGGMVEDGGMMTGAEHDSWRSMKGIKKACRNAEGRYKI
ncbi:Trafficking protein particle complex subunit 31 [Pleosporales sp. CAS-2024a]